MGQDKESIEETTMSALSFSWVEIAKDDGVKLLLDRDQKPRSEVEVDRMLLEWIIAVAVCLQNRLERLIFQCLYPYSALFFNEYSTRFMEHINESDTDCLWSSCR